MRTPAYVIGVAWVGFWLYWLIAATSAKRSKSMEIGRFIKIRLAILPLAVAMVVLVRSNRGVFAPPPLGDGAAALTCGLMLFWFGMAFAIWARIHLGRNWGMPMTQREDSELITGGPYGLVRHPIYTGILAMILGSAVVISGYWLIPFALALVFFIYSAMTEERVMVQEFPEAYPPYRSRTKMLIPFIL